ncbi:PREDICTED: protein FAM13A [Chrysochloris asiatica]|uniref:Protein FAM13A n=1 Tax=Chrysochloris asiatica TaxID=185453 RepID=A0A9B0WRY2_CHRAS|nr:PREDICTED: protein FAM13A [Chrysochloris asiatica]
MQPPVVNMTDCSLFLRIFKQSKTAVRMKEDMKKIVAVPVDEQRDSTYTKLFGVSLQELHQRGLTENGIPTIVRSIVEYLAQHGLTREGLFRVNGSVKVVEQLRLKYESGMPVDLGKDGDVCSAASLLKLFLRELPERVIPSALRPRFLQLFQVTTREHVARPQAADVKEPALSDSVQARGGVGGGIGLHSGQAGGSGHRPGTADKTKQNCSARRNPLNMSAQSRPAPKVTLRAPVAEGLRQASARRAPSPSEHLERDTAFVGTEGTVAWQKTGPWIGNQHDTVRKKVPETSSAVGRRSLGPWRACLQFSGGGKEGGEGCRVRPQATDGSMDTLETAQLKVETMNAQEDRAYLWSHTFLQVGPLLRPVPSPITTRPLNFVLVAVASVGFLAKDFKDCLWTQAPYQCMRHTPTHPNFPEIDWLPDGWTGVCGHVLIVVMPWLQSYLAIALSILILRIILRIIEGEGAIRTEKEDIRKQVSSLYSTSLEFKWYKGETLEGVPPGHEGLKEQALCNKIMATILENYHILFEVDCTENDNHRAENLHRLIIVKEASCKNSLPIILTKDIERDMQKPSPRSKIPKSRSEGSIQTHRVPQPKLSDGIPQVSFLLNLRRSCLDDLNLAEEVCGAKLLSSSQDDERPMSPFYLSAHVSQVSSVSTTGELLERTIRSAVEQHLFDVNSSGGQSSEDSETGTSSTASTASTRQRWHQPKEQDEIRRSKDMGRVNKENIPSGFSNLDDCILNAQEVEKLHENSSGYISERSNPKRQKSSPKLSELNENQDGLVNMDSLNSTSYPESTGTDDVELMSDESHENEKDGEHPQLYETSTMKIQEHPSLPDTKLPPNQDAEDQQESFVSEVPQLDLTVLCDEKSWEEPVPTFSAWQRENSNSEEAHLSPQAGRLISQLLEEDSDPMLSPRFYAYGQSRQYLDDTEVPPSPPNSHSFMRQRSSSLGSYNDEQEDLTPAQLTRRIQSLKKKIRKFEDRFEEERKYRPSHSDKAANTEVLRWTNDLAKFRKQLKESKLKISEEDLTPRMRQRSNTLPKSFGSQLEKEDEKKQELIDKAIKPSVEITLESIQRKLQEKRAETSRPDDIKDMTKDQIANEKVALQKALLYYESIHGRPVTKNERQVMKPLYDRYRLVKQILSRANTIPIIGSPSSKRRSPLLQPIIEGETASFIKEIKEEEEGSEDDTNTKPDFMVTLKTDFSERCFLDQFEDDADGFISPMDDKVPSKCNQDTGLSNLHAASIPELLEHLQEMREEKKQIRKKLRDFEDNFFRQNGRNVQKEDRTPMAAEYNEYKHIKAKLRLLEVLISKRDTDSKSM